MCEGEGGGVHTRVLCNSFLFHFDFLDCLCVLL